MTVKVIKTEPHHSVVKEVVCRNCGATLQYVPLDVQEYVHRDYGGGSDTVYYIKCPACNEQVNVRGY